MATKWGPSQGGLRSLASSHILMNMEADSTAPVNLEKTAALTKNLTTISWETTQPTCSKLLTPRNEMCHEVIHVCCATKLSFRVSVSNHKSTFLRPTSIYSQRLEVNYILNRKKKNSFQWYIRFLSTFSLKFILIYLFKPTILKMQTKWLVVSYFFMFTIMSMKVLKSMMK